MVNGTFIFIGAILVGIGVGKLLGWEDEGVFIGTGVGFILWGLLGGRHLFDRRRRD